MNSAMIELLILAAIAVFVFLRLKNVLGTRTGFENPTRPGEQARPAERAAPPRDFEVIEGESRYGGPLCPILPCGVEGLHELSFGAHDVKWRIANLSDVDLWLGVVTVTWPVDNGALEEVKLGRDKLFEGTEIHGGQGGVGGYGGPGGVGGPGGNGAAGGAAGSTNASFPSARGGRGGDGGAGGDGGGGGGGCGGVAYGIYAWGQGGADLSEWTEANSFPLAGTAGVGGQGGSSPANAGTAGATGDSGDTNF